MRKPRHDLPFEILLHIIIVKAPHSWRNDSSKMMADCKQHVSTLNSYMHLVENVYRIVISGRGFLGLPQRGISCHKPARSCRNCRSPVPIHHWTCGAERYEGVSRRTFEQRSRILSCLGDVSKNVSKWNYKFAWYGEGAQNKPFVFVKYQLISVGNSIVQAQRHHSREEGRKVGGLLTQYHFCRAQMVQCAGDLDGFLFRLLA